MIPIPATQQTLLRQPGANFSLAFRRMTDWADTEKSEKSEKKPIEMLKDLSCAQFQHCQELIAGIHRKQSAILKSPIGQIGIAYEIKAKCTSPFITGLGSEHPTETGMILDHNTGIPYLPGSTIKGVLRMACALVRVEEGETLDRGVINSQGVFEKIASGNEFSLPDDDPVLRKYFGDMNTSKKDSARGQLVFLDAYPSQNPTLKLDIMNPHYPKYYQHKSSDPGVFQGPIEIENPIPIKFLSVEVGTEFVFRLFASPLSEPSVKNGNVACNFTVKDQERIEKMYKKAFGFLGFGVKTAIGYGRFQIVSSTWVNAGVVAEPKNNIISQHHAVSPAKPRQYERVKCILNEKDKKGKWKVTCIDYPGFSGTIRDSDTIPEDKKIGDDVVLKISIVSGIGSAFDFR